MSTIIYYDSYNLSPSLYNDHNLRIVSHESTAENNINSLQPTREDGEVIISSNFGVKYIDLYGTVFGTSQSDLESNIDIIKEVVARKDKNLDIDYAGGTRRYVCRLISCDIDRNFFHLSFAPIHIRFLVPSGVGKDTSTTIALNDTGITATNTNNTFSILGGKIPKLTHTITFDTIGNADYIKLTNNNTGDYIEIDIPGFLNGNDIIIDEEDLTVQDDYGNNLTYRGKFPFLNRIGTVDFDLDIYGSGSTLDASQTSGTIFRAVIYEDGSGDTPDMAQSFIAGQSGNIEKLSFYIDKDGSPTGKMKWYIETDDNGKPSGTQASEEVYPGDFQIAAASVPASSAWTDSTLNGNAPYLTKGNKYWLKLYGPDMTGTDSFNFYGWSRESEDGTIYINGKCMARQHQTATWKDGVANSGAADNVHEGKYDATFKVYFGDGNAASYSVDWKVEYTKTYL